MNTLSWRALSAISLLLAGQVALADPPPPPPEGAPPAAPANQNARFSQQQLDQMMAPIALYPDPLLAQVMMASTYPLEVVEAARWSREHPDLKGDDAVRQVADRPWDPSVKSLVAFPQILGMMDQKLDWTEQLGDAFLGQQAQVNDTVQELRHKAMATNNLQSNQQVVVSQPTPQTIVIEQAAPDVVYVPYYDPYAVYGPWWWADYPPVYWHPWPGYYWHPGLFFAFGAGIVVGHGFFYGGYDWGHRNVVVYNNVNNYYYHGGGGGYSRNGPGPGPGGGYPRDQAPGGATSSWAHDPSHRRGVAYASGAVSQHYARYSASPGSSGGFQQVHSNPAAAAGAHGGGSPEGFSHGGSTTGGGNAISNRSGNSGGNRTPMASSSAQHGGGSYGGSYRSGFGGGAPRASGGGHNGGHGGGNHRR